MDNLKKLRNEIDKIDEKILELLDRRMAIASEIGRIKRNLGIPIEDIKREEEILNKAGIYREIFKKILEHSKRIQERHYIPNRLDGSIGIIGYGRMGKLFTRIFREYLDVYIYDIDPKKYDSEKGKICKSMNELLDKSEYIMVATDLYSISNVLKRIKSLIVRYGFRDKYIFDIATIKDEVINILKSFPHYVNVCSIHPLFGPNISTHHGERIIIIPIEDRMDEASTIADLFREMGFRVIYSDLDIHEYAMAYLITLPHIIGYIYGEVIKDSGINIDTYLTKSGEYFLKYYRDVVMEDGERFLSKIVRTSHGLEAINRYVKKILSYLENQ